jgi:ABC-type uncharacterized transport system substrate-binding protein
MKRREFIAGLAGATAWPAQQPDRMRRIGVLMSYDENDPLGKFRYSAFTQPLADLGWTDGRNVRMALRRGGPGINRIQALAQELVGLQPDIIVASSTPVTAALQQETRTIPIVFANVSDPVDSGILEATPLTYGANTLAGRSGFSTFRDALEQLGWIEGRNLRLDVRLGDGDARKTSALAADLVRLAPDVIVTVWGGGLRAVQQQTKTIPIVFIGAGDPVEGGTVTNEAHPEGNFTGFANAFGSLGGKWLELLKEVAPNITRVAHPYAPTGTAFLPSIRDAALSLGVQVVAMPVSDAARPATG